MTETVAPVTLLTDLAAVLNRHSAESASDTPDFILAEYLLGCLDIYNKTVRLREDWHGASVMIDGSHPAASDD